MDSTTIGILACTLLLAFSGFFDQIPVLNRRIRLGQYSFSLRLNFHSKPIFKIFFALLITGLSFLLTQHSSSASEAKANQQIRSRDSANRKHTDSILIATTDSMTRTWNKSLNEYYLTYISDQKKVQALIRDSMTGEIPSLDLFPITDVINANDTLSFQLLVMNKGNCPITVSFRAFSGEFINNVLFCSPSKVGITSVQYPIAHVDTFRLHTPNIHLANRVFYLFLGSYSGGKKPAQKIDKLYIWDEQLNRIGSPALLNYGDSVERLMKRKLKLN